MPNPWDPGTARAFAQMGFPALATTSAGVAWSLGRAAHAGAHKTLRSPLTTLAATGQSSPPLFERAMAIARIHAARAAIDATGTGVLLTARSEGFFVGRPDLDETIERLRAFARAGADCVYAPGVRDRDQIRAIVKAVGDTPVNLLASGPFITVEEAAAIGVRRISVGGAIARVAWAGTLAAAAEIAEHGTFGTLATGTPSSDLNRRFGGA